MNFTLLLRPPLVWVAAAEAFLVALLGLVTWQVWQQHTAPAAVAKAPSVSAPFPGAGQLRPPPQPSSAPPSAAPRPVPTPAIGTDPGFLAREMAELNRAEAAFEDLEWRATSAITDAIQKYVTGMVLPSIERQERGRR